MAEPEKDFPPVRACLFDMDGLLINTEDIYTLCADIVLQRHGRPRLPWSIKARLMGVPDSSNGDVFHEWARLPISREQWRDEQLAEQTRHFPDCQPLPGAERLLAHLASDAACPGVHAALASSTSRVNFAMKKSGPGGETRRMLDLIPERRQVLGDDPRVRGGRGKPAPDIYLLALAQINETLPPGEREITPRECLVFEDSVVGVEAGRRAGMRVLWVPHEGLAAEYVGKEAEVLAGRIGLVGIGDEHELGQPGDGWGQQLASLEDFPYAKYGIPPPL
ncbi:hypothetical protein RB594_008797 [Gaeumannomyces avenae]